MMTTTTSTDPVQLARVLDYACRRAWGGIPLEVLTPLRQLAEALVQRGWISVDQDLFEDALAAAIVAAPDHQAARDLLRIHALYLAWDRAAG